MKISRILVLVALVVGSFTGFAQRPIPIANQAETDWQDDRWNEMQSGRFQSFIVPLPSGTLLKGFGVLVGEKGEATVCWLRDGLHHSHPLQGDRQKTGGSCHD